MADADLVLEGAASREAARGTVPGPVLHGWIEQIRPAKNVRTWGDLKDDDPGSSLSPAQRYKLDNGLAAGQKFLAKWDWVKWQPGDYTPLA